MNPQSLKVFLHFRFNAFFKVNLSLFDSAYIFVSLFFIRDTLRIQVFVIKSKQKKSTGLSNYSFITHFGGYMQNPKQIKIVNSWLKVRLLFFNKMKKFFHLIFIRKIVFENIFPDVLPILIRESRQI